MLLHRLISTFLLVSFFLTSLGPIPKASAQNDLDLPVPGAMISLSQAYMPVMIKGLKIHPENPLMFDFILDTGKSGLNINSAQFKAESQKLIKYFLASLTIKEDDLWVNLSPYEKDRMIPSELGKTELGRDMLAQDYILKQLTASLIYPEKDLGRKFWDNVYSKARQQFGTTNIPVNTFNKVWIVADKAKVLERNNTAFVVGSHLKVMLEEDYQALSKHDSGTANDTHNIGSQIVRQIILPELEKEVNQGQNFAPLRQMFYSMILASWYKISIKNALLNQVYSNKAKTGGVLSDDPEAKQKIYEQYLKAYKKGVFNYIKQDIDAATKQPMPRKYFSGGEELGLHPGRNLQITPAQLATSLDRAALSPEGNMAMASVRMDKASISESGRSFPMTSVESIDYIKAFPLEYLEDFVAQMDTLKTEAEAERFIELIMLIRRLDRLDEDGLLELIRNKGFTVGDFLNAFGELQDILENAPVAQDQNNKNDDEDVAGFYLSQAIVFSILPISWPLGMYYWIMYFSALAGDEDGENNKAMTTVQPNEVNAQTVPANAAMLSGLDRIQRAITEGIQFNKSTLTTADLSKLGENVSVVSKSDPEVIRDSLNSYVDDLILVRKQTASISRSSAVLAFAKREAYLHKISFGEGSTKKSLYVLYSDAAMKPIDEPYRSVEEIISDLGHGVILMPAIFTEAIGYVIHENGLRVPADLKFNKSAGIRNYEKLLQFFREHAERDLEAKRLYEFFLVAGKRDETIARRMALGEFLERVEPVEIIDPDTLLKEPAEALVQSSIYVYTFGASKKEKALFDIPTSFIKEFSEFSIFNRLMDRMSKEHNGLPTSELIPIALMFPALFDGKRFSQFKQFIDKTRTQMNIVRDMNYEDSGMEQYFHKKYGERKIWPFIFDSLYTEGFEGKKPALVEVIKILAQLRSKLQEHLSADQMGVIGPKLDAFISLSMDRLKEAGLIANDFDPALDSTSEAMSAQMVDQINSEAVIFNVLNDIDFGTAENAEDIKQEVAQQWREHGYKSLNAWAKEDKRKRVLVAKVFPLIGRYAQELEKLTAIGTDLVKLIKESNLSFDIIVSRLGGMKYGDTQFAIFRNKMVSGMAAALWEIQGMKKMLKTHKQIKEIFAAAPSQVWTAHFLVHLSKDLINWNNVHIFHMDEWIPEDGRPMVTMKDSESFRRWIKLHYVDQIRRVHGEKALPPENVHYFFDDEKVQKEKLEQKDKWTPQSIADAYTREFNSIDAPIRVVGGIGENGHMAFNDRIIGDAKFNEGMYKDLEKIVDIRDPNEDPVNQGQQFNDYSKFKKFGKTPRAVTLRMPLFIYKAKSAVLSVPGKSKSPIMKEVFSNDLNEPKVRGRNPEIPANVFVNEFELHNDLVTFTDVDGASQLPMDAYLKQRYQEVSKFSFDAAMSIGMGMSLEQRLAAQNNQSLRMAAVVVPVQQQIQAPQQTQAQQMRQAQKALIATRRVLIIVSDKNMHQAWKLLMDTIHPPVIIDHADRANKKILDAADTVIMDLDADGGLESFRILMKSIDPETVVLGYTHRNKDELTEAQLIEWAGRPIMRFSRDNGNLNYDTITAELAGEINKRNKLKTDMAALAQPLGGIDLNAKKMGLDIEKQDGGVQMEVNAGMISEFEKGDFTGVEGVILRILPIVSPLAILGLETSSSEERLAKV